MAKGGRGRHALIVTGLVALAISCEGKRPATTDRPATTPAPVAGPPAATALPVKSARPGDPEPDPITHPCVVDEARFTQALKDRDDRCSTDADCACYNGGMRASGCGGVTSAKTAAQLAAIAEQFRKDGCRSGINCAAWACRPECASGRCRNGR